MSSREVVLRDLREATEAAVSTIAGEYVRSRMMHYAVTDDFTFYLASMKGDPKIIHITHNPSINLMILRKVGDPSRYMDLSEFAKWREIEVQGKASIVRSREEREYALRLLSERSPIVKLLSERGETHVLEVIRVEPHVIRYKVVSDILSGKPPIVLEFLERGGEFVEFGRLIDKLRTWYAAVRAPFLVAGVPSVALGALIALKVNGVFNPLLFALTLIGVLLGHISVNLLNDYYDHKLRTDVVNTEYVRPFSGGSRVLQLGLLTPLEVLSGALIALLIFIAIGIYLSIVSGPLVLLLTILGGLSMLAYNAPPLRLSGRGLGEAIVGINFGILITLGSFAVQTGSISFEALAASVPLAILVALILLVNEFPDYRADKATGRRTLVVILGRGRARWLYLALSALTYVYILAGSLTGILPPYALAALIAAPLTAYAFKEMLHNYENPFDMIPSYIATIISHLSVGFLLVMAYLVVAIRSPIAILASIALIGAYATYEIYQIRRDLRAFLAIKGLVRTI